jgi:hypothetical protein
MARPSRVFKVCSPVLLSWLCAVGTGCQCSFNCTPTFKGPNCGPNGCGAGYGGQGCGGGNCGPNVPAGAGQWAQTGHDASHQPGQWGQGCNSPPMGGYGPPPAYAMNQGYQQPMPPQQLQSPVQLGPTPIPERAPDRMPNVQGNNMNMNVPYSGTLTNGQYFQGGSGQMPFSQGAQGMPFGPTPTMQQGNPNMQGPISRPMRQGEGNENTLPAPRIMPTEAPYSP